MRRRDQCWKTRNISRGRGRARGSNLKIFAGAGGRGGQILKFSRARAGAGAKIFLAGGRGRAPARKPPHGRPRAPTRANLKIYNHFRNLNFGKKHYLILFLDKNNIFKLNKTLRTYPYFFLI